MPDIRWRPMAFAVAWTLFILVLLSIPSNQLPSSQLWKYDKLAHSLLFFVLAFVWMRAFAAHSVRMIVFLLVCGLAFAPLTELYQSILPFGRRMDLMDSIADAIGFGLGTVAWVLWEKFRPSSREQL